MALDSLVEVKTPLGLLPGCPPPRGHCRRDELKWKQKGDLASHPNEGATFITTCFVPLVGGYVTLSMTGRFSQLLHLGVPTFLSVDALAPQFRPWDDAPSRAQPARCPLSVRPWSLSDVRGW